MSNSKPLPPFTFDVLCNLNRDQLERFSIVCRPLKNCIDRYFHSKPYRIFHYLGIRGGSYALVHNGLRWCPNHYSVQQFLGQVETSYILHPTYRHDRSCPLVFGYIDPRLVFQNDWAQFFEQPGLKPVVVFRNLNQYCIENIFDQLFMAFSSAVSQNAFKIVFVQRAGPLFKFHETNSMSGEILELKAGLPTEFSVEHQYDWMGKNGLYKYTLERSSI